jgi:phosphoadenosine phosphosulfate reductase
LESVEARGRRLAQACQDLATPALLDALIHDEFPGRIALVSSFGTESALLLSLIAEVERDLPVIFIDTEKMFAETLEYRDQLTRRLGLTNVRTVSPSRVALADRDPNGELWQFDTDACCQLRKVEPLAIASAPFDALISGRKRYHGAIRRFIPRIEVVDGKIKVDPIAHWSQERVETEFVLRGLPPHPLKAEGYLSVGCAPCTIPVSGDSGSVRAGRWAGTGKTECGIHFPVGLAKAS